MKRLVKAWKEPRAINPAKTGAFLKPRNVDSNRQAQGKQSIRGFTNNVYRLIIEEKANKWY
jgi:hypothetical protein